jgi:hypothetical protein
MTTATGNAVLRAYSKAVKKLDKDPLLLANLASAGFIIPNGQKRGQRKGYQVFVWVTRYSDELLKKKPLSGGLHAKL